MHEGGGRILGLPVRNPSATLTAVVVALTTYLFTRYPGLSVWDSPLIAQVAAEAGLGHPPGYPLHTLLGALLARVPGLTIPSAVGLLSVVPAALMIIPAASLAAQLRDPASAGAAWAGWGEAAFLTALFLHPTIWDFATRIEVYALAAFLGTWGLARLGAELGTLDEGGAHRGPNLWLPGLFFGLGAAVHPVAAGLTALAGLGALVRFAVRAPVVRRKLPAFLAGGALGLFPYLWIPFVADRTDRLVWGSPTDLSSLWHFLRARDFARNVGPDAAAVASHVFDWIGWAVLTGTLLFALLGLAGWLLLGRRQGPFGRTPPLALLLAVLAIAFNVVWVPENPDYLGYLAGPLVLTGAGGAALVAYLAGRQGWAARGAGVAALLAVVLVAAVAPPALAARTRHRDNTARLLAEGALDESAPGGILLLDSDHWVWPLFYLQAVEGRRPDVVLLPVGLAGSSWFWQRLYRLHPELEPFAVRGPGGRIGRIRRFLAAQRGRSLAAENVGLTRLGGFAPQGVGWLVWGQPVSEAQMRAATAAIEGAARVIGGGSADGTGTLALVSYVRGEALWTLGQAQAAHRALLAGVPPALRPAAAPAATRWKEIPPLRRSLPAAQGLRGLGDPARNLELARFLAEGGHSGS